MLCAHQLPGPRHSTPSVPLLQPTPRSRAWCLHSVCVSNSAFGADNGRCFLACWCFSIDCSLPFRHLSDTGPQPTPCRCFSRRCPSAHHDPVQVCCWRAQPPATHGLPATGHHAAGKKYVALYVPDILKSFWSHLPLLILHFFAFQTTWRSI